MGQSVSKDEILRRLEEQKLALDRSAIVAQTDAKGIITYVNDKFCEISEYPQNELLGRSHQILNSGVHPKSFFENMWRTISRGEIWRGDVCNRGKSGKLYWVSTTIVPFLDDSGRPRQYLAIRQDITELKEAQQKIMQQQEQLVTNSRLSTMGEMAATITHEINNPLGVIMGRCEMLKSLLQRGVNDPTMLQKLVDAIEVNSQRIEKIVRSMRTLAHGGEADPYLLTPLCAVADDALDLCAERIRNHGAQLRVKTVGSDVKVECRSHELLQVIVNLLNNSFDAVSSLSEKWISLELRDCGREVEILVSDSGGGIPADVATKIFDPFYSTKRVQYGTGLGLSISRSLILRHHGSLDLLRNAPNTTFRIVLPKHQPLQDKK